MNFSVLCCDLDTENSGKITICYTEYFAKKFGNATSKYSKFHSDFRDVLVDNVLKNSMTTDGHIMRADTKELKRVGSDDTYKAYKIRKFWSTDLGNKRSVRFDYIFDSQKKILFFVDLRFKSNNNETNHNENMIRDIMDVIKPNKYSLLNS